MYSVTGLVDGFYESMRGQLGRGQLYDHMRRCIPIEETLRIAVVPIYIYNRITGHRSPVNIHVSSQVLRRSTQLYRSS